MKIAQNILNTFFPPIVGAKDLIKEIKPDKSIINLSQGIPSIMPPNQAVLMLTEKMSELESIHKYSDDRGIPELREEIKKDIYERHGIKIGVENILITAGANMAFFQAILTLLNSGDTILIPSPYYFNYVMAANFLNVEVREVNILNEDIFLEEFRNKLSDKLDAVLFINPENPTGRVYDKEFLREVYKVSLKKNIVFIYDEVYRDFYIEDGARHYSPIEEYGISENLIILGSFSKSYGMTGYRVGYLIADKEFIWNLLKVQDTNIICAPVASQYLAYYSLKYFKNHPEEYVERLKKSVEIFCEKMKDVDWFNFRKPEGAIYTLLNYDFPIDGNEMVKMLYEREGILTVSGNSFGRFSNKSLRISFNDLDVERILELKKRFEEFGKWIKEK